MSNKERPILFSAPMVRAILAGTKTQTRRLIKPQPLVRDNGGMVNLCRNEWAVLDGCLAGLWKCPYGEIGDKLWVRETFSYDVSEMPPIDVSGNPICKEVVVYMATDDDGSYFWRPSIHMRRDESRIDLEVINVRIEKLKDISEEDCYAEGISRSWEDWPLQGHEEALITPSASLSVPHPKWAYECLWSKINGCGSWDKNPWVWVIEFDRISP